MAWPEHKSPLQRRLNVRWMRWAFWRCVFNVLPAAKWLSFPQRSVEAMLVAEELIDHSVTTGAARLTEWDNAFAQRARVNDKRSNVAGSTDPCLFRRQIAIIPRCAVLGHVGAAIKSECGSLLNTHASDIPNWNRAKPRLLRRKRFGGGLVTWLDGAKHYFHFFASMLPLLSYLESEHRQDRPLTVLIPADGHPFQNEVCNALASAYAGLSFQHVASSERLEIENYLWLYQGSANAEWLPANREVAQKLGAILRVHYGLAKPSGGKLMFFSRGHAKLRRLLNESELEEIASEHGFERFEANAGNHKDQLQRFGNADTIIAVHGAGLTNLLFARPGSTVIEIFPEDCVKSTYLWLARALGLNYLPLIGGKGDYRQAFELPADRFVEGLDRAMKIRESKIETVVKEATLRDAALAGG